MAVQNDYGRVSADFENWRRQQEAAQAAALEQQRIAEEQQRAAQAAAEQQARQAEAMRQIQAQQQAQQAQAQQIQQMQAAQQQSQAIPGLQTAQQTQNPTPNYAEQARAIGLPWSPNDADYVQQINDYNARVNKIQQTAAERQATTDALRQQIAQNPALLEMGKQNLANDKQLNSLADQLNAFYAKQNNVNQDDAQKAYTTAVLRTQIAQNPELFANAVKQFASKGNGRKARKQEAASVLAAAMASEPYTPPYATSGDREDDIRSIADLKRMDYDMLKKKI